MSRPKSTDWLQSATLAVQQLALAGRGFTVDHLLDLVGTAPCPSYVGVVMAAAQRKGLIEAVGCRIGRDGRLVRTWWPAERHDGT